MSYGFASYNDNGEIIVSDFTDSFHFVRKATQIGSANTGFDAFPGYGGTYSRLDGRTIITYEVLFPTAAPLVFLKPSNVDEFAAVIRIYKSGTPGTTEYMNYWRIDVMMTGIYPQGPYPELFCFTRAEVAPTENINYGLQVFKSDGVTTAFDSRARPLSVLDGSLQVPPEDPTNSPGTPRYDEGYVYPWKYAVNDHDFRSTNRYSTYSLTNSTDFTDLMYCCPSIAQATYARTQNGYKKSRGTYSSQEHWSTATWWVMYRNLFRLQPGQFQSGWGPLAADYYFSAVYEDGGTFGGGGGSWTTGTNPYEPKTINLIPNMYLVTNSKFYD